MTKKNKEKIKKALIKKKEELLRSVKYIHNNEQAPLEFGDEADLAQQSLSREIFFNLSDKQRQILEDIDLTLQKLKTKRYGICEACHKPIPLKRLLAVPYTHYCTKCQATRDRIHI